MAKREKNKIKVRRHYFASTGNHIPVSDLPQLYMIFRALDGDELAREILDANETVIKDSDGKIVYPPQQDADNEI